MISINVKSFYFIFFVASAVNRNILCASISNAFEVNRWNTRFGSNSTYEEIDDLDANRIAGGQYALPNQFPFMAVVHQLLGNGIVSKCGGTIISSRWVLTAGHCVASGPYKFLVVFGTRDQSGIGYNFYNGPGVAMLTNQAVLHPEYQITVNDIALLYMPRNIPFGLNVQPITLAAHNYIEESFANKMGIIIGWGKDGPYGTGTNKLKYAILPIISNYDCSMYWAITEKHICTSAAYRKDACQGDSGGPLIVLVNEMPLQVGIVSYGDGFCPSDKPGVFTRVSPFVDWIQEVTNL